MNSILATSAPLAAEVSAFEAGQWVGRLILISFVGIAIFKFVNRINGKNEPTVD